MAYLERIETTDSQQVELPEWMEAPRPAEPDFTPLQWSIVRLARADGLWTLRLTGRLLRFWNWLLGRANPELANPELEALRRMAVLTWHFGFTVPGEDVADFLSAGFSPEQYELLAGSINAALANRQRMAA